MSDPLGRAAATLTTLQQQFIQLGAGPRLACRLFSDRGSVSCPEGYQLGSGDSHSPLPYHLWCESVMVPREPIIPCPAGLEGLAEEVVSEDGECRARFLMPRGYGLTIFTASGPVEDVAQGKAACEALSRFTVLAKVAGQCLGAAILQRLRWADPRTSLVRDFDERTWLLVVFDLAVQRRPGSGVEEVRRQRIWRRENTTVMCSWEDTAATLRALENQLGPGLSPYGDILSHYGDTLPDFFECEIRDVTTASVHAAGVLAEELRKLAPHTDSDRRPLPPERHAHAAVGGSEPTTATTSGLEADGSNNRNSRPSAIATVADLAAECGVSPDAMGSALRRFAGQHPDCREPLANPRPREPKHVYRRAAVQPVLDRFQRDGRTDGRKK